MYTYDAKKLSDAFRTVRKNTIQIAEEIPEDKYDYRPAEGTRTVAETLKDPRFARIGRLTRIASASPSSSSRCSQP